MASAAPTTGQTVPPPPPNNTKSVYIRNLEESIKIDDLTELLRDLFSQYGKVLDVVAKKNLKAKGQAFVVFDTVQAATQAIQEVQGFSLHSKPMVLQYAKTKSDATVKQFGSAEDFELHKRRRMAEKERKQALAVAEAQKNLKRTAVAAPVAAADARPVKRPLKSTNKSDGHAIADEYLPPNKVLFLQNLPHDIGADALSSIFGQYPGFKEVRMVPGRKGIAFVEYESNEGAISAKENTAGMQLGDQTIKVTYQRQ